MPLSGSQAVPSAGAAARRPPASVWHAALLLIVGILWGVQPALIKLSLGGSLGEIETLALVLAAVAITLGLSLKVRRRFVRPAWSVARFMIIAGFCEYAAPLLVTFLVAAHIDAVLMTLIIATTPVFTVAFAAAIGAEPLRRETVLACLVGIAAMAVIVVPENALPSREMLPWCLFSFLIPVFYSIGTLYVSRAWPDGYDSVQVAFVGAMAAAIMLSPFWVQPILSGAIAATTAKGLVVAAALALSVVLELVLYFYLLQHAGPVFTSFSSFVMIASGFIGGMAIFGERPSVWIWFSVALFALSLALVFWRREQKFD